MRKILFLTAVLGLVLSLPAISHAAPAGNPADPVLLEGTYPIKAEGLIDIVFDRDLDLSGDNAKVEGIWYLAKVGLTLIEKIDIYGLLGTADFKLENWRIANDYDMESDYSLAWGGGAKLLLYETEEYGDGILRVTVDGNYRRYDPSIETVKKDGTELTGITAKELEYQEWQASLGLSYTLDQMTPYIGVKYSDCQTEMSLTEPAATIAKVEANSDDVVGVFVGLDYLFAENISVNLEGRFIDETALNVGLKINF